MKKSDAYLLGYKNKQANVATDAASKVGGKAIDAGKIMAMALPVLAGAGMGSFISQATSPTKKDEEAIQRELHALELAETKAELIRRKELDKKKQQLEESKADTSKRSLRF